MMALNRLISAFLIIVGLSVAVPAALAEPEPAMADGWHVLESHGGVRFRPAREQHWWRARTGSKIPHGSIIATGSSGFLIIARAGESITVRPSSRVELPGEATGDQVRQVTGDLRYRITRMPDRRFAVETPYLSLLVKGTVFEVVVGDRGAEVQVTEGRVRVDAARGQVVELTPGQSARIASGAQADLEFRPEPESPFVAAPSSPGSIAAAYSNDDSGQATSDRRPTAGQGARSDRIVPGRGAGGQPGSDAAVSRARSASDGAGGSAGPRDPAGGGSGIEIGISEGRLSVDIPTAQIGAVTPERDTMMARSARADLESGTAPTSSFAAPLPEPQRTAVAQSGDDAERGVGDRPRAIADEPTNRVAQASAGDGRSSDALVWAVLVVLTVALWWRLRRSRHRQSFGPGAARQWPWQRSRLEPSGPSAGSASLGRSSLPPGRDRP